MQKTLLHIDDIVFGFATGGVGVPLPDDLTDVPVKRLRVDGNTVIDIESVHTFYIDENGMKHIVSAPDRQELNCSWDDELIYSDSSWSVINQSDLDARLIYETEIKIDALSDSVYTKSASRAARYERKRDQAIAYRDAGYPADATPYPYLTNEALERGITNQEMADLILVRSDLFENFGADIETLRAKLKNDVAAAADDTAKQAAADAIIADVQTLTDALLGSI